MSDDMWRECTDPDELAAAVSAQMRVEYEWGGEWRATWRATSDQFRRGLNDGYRYRVPGWWRMADEELVDAVAAVLDVQAAEIIPEPVPPLLVICTLDQHATCCLRCDA